METELRNKAGLMGLARLMKMAFDGEDLAPLGEALIKRADSDPLDIDALMDLSTVLQLRHNQEVALDVQAQALATKILYHLPAGGEAKIRLLAIMAPGDIATNAPLEFLVEDSDISLHMLYVGPGLPPVPPLPEHDVLFVSIGESTRTNPILEELAPVLKSWPHPVLNMPANILKTSREAAPVHLSKVAGLVMPEAKRVHRANLSSIRDFPFIVRPVDSHGGHGLAKIDDGRQITDYLEKMSDPEFYVSPFVDYRSADGLYRKYRVALIKGHPYAAHMGISDNWMIHYANAGMDDSMKKREEEARFMKDFDEDFARRHREALKGLNEILGLDYVVLDCAETRDGKLLVFEADTGAVVHAMDPVGVFPYKAPQMKKVFAAFRDMLIGATRAGT
ncbi:MAG: ATP-grasp domain-containing protein [Burkholderiales bacterium]